MRGKKSRGGLNKEFIALMPQVETHLRQHGQSTSVDSARLSKSIDQLDINGNRQGASMGSNSATRYRMSFSTGGLCVNESVQLGQLYLARGDWNDVKVFANDQKILGFRTQSSSKRTVRELITRLRELSKAELELLTEASRKEQALLLWLAVCRTYPFVAEFAIEVLQEHFLSLRMAISHADFDQFFDAKAEWNGALAEISPSTRAKLRQVLFRMMREVDIVSKDGALNPIHLSAALKNNIITHDPKGLKYFPGSQTECGA